MTILVDFDGTVARSDYPVIIGEMPYAKEVITKLYQEGHYIVLWTCRTGNALIDAINWMLEHGIPFSSVNRGHPDNIAKYGDEGRKVYGHMQIDDKNVGGFPGWKYCYDEVQRLEREYQKSLVNNFKNIQPKH